MWVVLELLKSTKRADFAIFEDADAITQMQKVYGVGHENASFIFQDAQEDLFEDLLAYICVQGRDRIVCHDDITVSIHGTCEARSCLLST